MSSGPGDHVAGLSVQQHRNLHGVQVDMRVQEGEGCRLGEHGGATSWLRLRCQQGCARPARAPQGQESVDQQEGAVQGRRHGCPRRQAALQLCGTEHAAGRLIDLCQERPFDVPLYWQRSRLALPWLQALTVALEQVASVELRP